MLRDEDFEVTLANLLRAGVLIAAGVVVAGGALYVARHGGSTPEYARFRSEPFELRTLGGIWADALAFRARGIIQLGLLLLIATPVARVAFSVTGFARERDWQYVGYTLVVLALLLFSLFAGS